MHHPTAVSGLATLPPAGRLEVYPAAADGAGGVQGVGLVLDRLEPASSTVVQVSAGTRSTLSCSAGLPAPGEAAIRFSVQPTQGGMNVSVGGQTTHCRATLPPMGPLLRSGLRRVRVAELTLGDRSLAAPGPGGRGLLWALGALLVGGLAAGLSALGWRSRTTIICLSPLLGCAWLSGVELHAWAETARVLWLPVPWLSALLPVGFSLVLLSITALAQASREGAPDWGKASVMVAGLGLLPALLIGAGLSTTWATLAGLSGAVIGGVLLVGLFRLLGSRSPTRSAALASATGSTLAVGVGLTHPLGPSAIVYAYLAGALLLVLIWANINPRVARAYNLSSTVLALVIIGCLEVVLRFSTAGQSWMGTRAGPMSMDIFSEVQTTEQEFAVFDAGKPTAYPSAGYPVRVPEASGAIRIITAGSSSTGGAYQNDRLSDFYPARMQELLGQGYQVINQGVGGWTTFHIDHYIDSQIEALSPDVLTLYVGHNDQLTALPRPVREMYGRIHSGGSGVQLAARLGRYRLYQGLRYAVASLRPAQSRVAVPLDHARENLSKLVKLMGDRGGKMVLASEGLSPDPGPLQPYFEMMAELAKSHPHVGYVDTAAALHLEPPAAVFLDDSHLTDRGHRLVAGMLADAISELERQ
jgi:lysophospholipase L1-like esterase